MITVIGDVHGKHDKYMEIVKNCDYSLQVGDFGFNYRCLDSLDKNKHKVLLGNHDNYDIANYSPNVLGDFGMLKLNNMEIFYVRGAYSIDRDYRRARELYAGQGKSWWFNEELSYTEMLTCTKEYELAKPSIVVSHSCPRSIVPIMTNPNILKKFGIPTNFESNTQLFLQTLLEIHQPEIWIFGHFHRNWTQQINGTRFRCLKELAVTNL